MKIRAVILLIFIFSLDQVYSNNPPLIPSYTTATTCLHSSDFTSLTITVPPVKGATNYSRFDEDASDRSESSNLRNAGFLSLSAVTTNVDCYGNCNGSISLTVGGGMAPYSYYWSSLDTTQDIGSLCSGTYCVTVIDSNNDTISDCYNINVPVQLTFTGTVSDVTCNGDGNGSVNIAPEGGLTPYSFLWSNGSTTEDIDSLNGGNYSVSITDVNGCIISDNFNVFEPVSIGLSASIANVFPCFGDNNGSINLFVTGGISPYSYVWSNGEITDNISNLTAGVYSVIVTDVNGCEATGYYIIDEPYQLTINGVTTNPRCNGNCDGSIDISITGGA
ncbi:MAG: SprB repeat-containing protein, partial [Bacteroidia bacterium]|nr:SprB repeat-containing protein [Bacteroidia bacterium]